MIIIMMATIITFVKYILAICRLHHFCTSICKDREHFNENIFNGIALLRSRSHTLTPPSFVVAVIFSDLFKVAKEEKKDARKMCSNAWSNSISFERWCVHFWMIHYIRWMHVLFPSSNTPYEWIRFIKLFGKMSITQQQHYYLKSGSEWEKNGWMMMDAARKCVCECVSFRYYYYSSNSIEAHRQHHPSHCNIIFVCTHLFEFHFTFFTRTWSVTRKCSSHECMRCEVKTNGKKKETN